MVPKLGATALKGAPGIYRECRKFLETSLLLTNESQITPVVSPQVHKLWAPCPHGGASCLYEGHIYFEWTVGARKHIYSLVGTLLGRSVKLALFYNLNFTKVYINLEKYIIH
jgi:hypothetical protein